MTEAKRYAAYAYEKSAWLAAHPMASSEQFEAACREIAERLGL